MSLPASLPYAQHPFLTCLPALCPTSFPYVLSCLMPNILSLRAFLPYAQHPFITCFPALCPTSFLTCFPASFQFRTFLLALFLTLILLRHLVSYFHFLACLPALYPTLILLRASLPYLFVFPYVLYSLLSFPCVPS
jgi:hypothetical protein